MSTASTPTPTGSNPGTNPSGPTSSPLLFFVALGFGVVFTNLWIIVGVKYCFRYNRRRAAAANGEIDPIDLTAMPRPHRRRREKKLMSMDDVNERFPLTKYKTWKSSRETNGLPASGGIATAPQSRAGSIKDVEAAVSAKEQPTTPQPETTLSMARDDLAAPPSSAQKIVSPRASVDGKHVSSDKHVEQQENSEKSLPTTEVVETSTAAPQAEADSDGDDDDPIATAAAPEMMAEPGDTCAICIDTLEDDEDIRGLSCGHAFHASCVDPWLTSRRACCPLCKADYYVPKPRPEGELDLTTGRRPAVGLVSPQAVWTTTRGNPFSRSRVILIHSQSGQHASRTDRLGRASRPSRPTRAANENTMQQTTEQVATTSTWRSRFQGNRAQGPTFSNWFARNRTTTTEASSAPPPQPQPTPGQLEAGNR